MRASDRLIASRVDAPGSESLPASIRDTERPVHDRDYTEAHTVRHLPLALFAGIAALGLFALTACSDSPSAPAPSPDPEQQKVLVGTRIQLIKKPNLDYSVDYSLPQQPFPASQSPAEWCKNAAINTKPLYVSSQMQNLVWDDYSILQTPPSRDYNGIVISGRFEVKFRGYVGSYGGQPIQCVWATKTSIYKYRYMPWETGQAADPAALFYTSNQNWGFCLGATNCASRPATVHAQVGSTFRRYCDIDVAVSTCMQYIWLGAVSIFTGYDPGYLDGGEWDVMVRADGYWSAYDYGGNAGSPHGFWSTQRTGYDLLESYYYRTNPGFNANRDGRASWHLYN